MHDEAERASRKAMAVIAPETNETSEIGYGVNESATESTGNNDLNNDTSANNRVEPDDDDDNVSKRVLRIK